MKERTAVGLTNVHKALADPVRLRLLETLWSGQRSAKELSTAAGAPPDRLYYHLKKLEHAGLVRVRDYRQLPGGKVERVYEAVEAEPPGDAPDPEQVTPFLEAVLEATRSDLHAAGVRAKNGSRGKRHLTRTTVQLSARQIDQVAEEVANVVERYSAEADTDAGPVRCLWTLIELPATAP